nr:hypothetical protein [Tanacetum cinerariifolium]
MPGQVIQQNPGQPDEDRDVKEIAHRTGHRRASGRPGGGVDEHEKPEHHYADEQLQEAGNAVHRDRE